MDMNQETKVTVIDDRLRQEEAETLLLLRCLEQWR